MLITGAASGIGAAVAQRLAAVARGGLILVDHDEAGLAAMANNLVEPPERVSLLAFDIANPERWQAAQRFMEEHYGRLDWAVASAGVAHAAPLMDTPFSEWRTTMGVNLDGMFLTIQTAFRLMRQAPFGGALAVLSSAAAHKAEPGIAAYGASKAGVEQLAKVAAKEGADLNIRVNVIAPGGVETPMWRGVPMFQEMVAQEGSERAAFDKLAALATPLRRYAQADDIARMVEMLLCESAPITGATIVVDGGYTL